jgi:putative transposase
LLEQTLEECRWLYNHLLEKRKTAYEQEAKSLSCYGQINTYPMLKEKRPSLNIVHSQVLQNVAVRVDLAMKAFFRRVKSFCSNALSEARTEFVDARNKATGGKPGYPRFKGYGRYDSFTYPQSGFRITPCSDDQRSFGASKLRSSERKTHDSRVSLSKIGSVKTVYHRPVCDTIKTATIHKSSTGKWYITFSCETEPEHLPECHEQVGIDVGLKTFATISNVEEIANPRFFRKEQKALAKVQRKHSKLAKGTPERRKHRKIVARVHEQTKFKRQNFTHQQSRQIVDSFGVICVEDLAVNRMMHNHCLAKSISDAAWSAFFSQLSCKAEEAGRQFVKVNPAYTSQTCSRCGHRHKMPLSERVYHCPCCLLAIDRDLNAALNILRLGLESLGIQPLEAPCL